MSIKSKIKIKTQYNFNKVIPLVCVEAVVEEVSNICLSD